VPSEVELHRLQWMHPVHGRVSEVVCPAHEDEVMTAHRVLGIGSSGCVETERDACDRCRHPGRLVREWIGEVLRAD
jgi:hypothetical protein